MKKILITGGAGFLGYYLAENYSRDNRYYIHLADNLSEGAVDTCLKKLIKNNNVKLINIDLTQAEDYSFLDRDYDYVYAFAGIVGVKNVIDNPSKTLAVNILSIFNLLEWLRTNCRRTLKRLVFASTSEVYSGTLKHYSITIPTGEDVNLTLDDIFSSRTTYALSKIVGESACISYFKQFKIPITIIRYHNIYGPRMGLRHVIPELLVKAKNAKKYVGVYSIKHKRAFCFIADAIEATLLLANSKNSIGQIFNVGNSKEEITMQDLASRIIKIVNSQLKTKSLGNHLHSPSRRCPDITKLKKTINFKPKICLDEGLKLTWDWYKNN